MRSRLDRSGLSPSASPARVCRPRRRRREWILRKQVEDVGEEDFLMLLFVVAAKLDQGRRFGRHIFVHPLHRFVDTCPIGINRIE